MHRHTTQKSGRRLKETSGELYDVVSTFALPGSGVCMCVCVYALVYVFCMYLYACGKYGVSSRSSRARASYTVLTLSSVKFVSIFHDHSDSNLPRPVSLCPRGLGFHLGVRPIPRAFDVSSPFLPFPSPPSSTSRPISLSPPSSAPFSPVHPVFLNGATYTFSPSLPLPGVHGLHSAKRREPRRRL